MPRNHPFAFDAAGNTQECKSVVKVGYMQGWSAPAWNGSQVGVIQRFAASRVLSGDVLNISLASGAPFLTAAMTFSKRYVFPGIPRIPMPTMTPSSLSEAKAFESLSTSSSGRAGMNL